MSITIKAASPIMLIAVITWLCFITNIITQMIVGAPKFYAGM